MNKKIIFWSLLGLASLYSCEKDEDRAVISENIKAPSITFPENGYTKVISQADTSNTLVITWDTADYGVVSPVTYIVYLDKAGNNFNDSIVLGTVENNDSLVLDIMSLNTTLMAATDKNGLGLTENIESSLELKVVASLNTQAMVSSPVINLKITPWKKVIQADAEIQLISFDGGAIIATFPESSNTGIYSGFVKISDDSIFTIKDVRTQKIYGATGGTLVLNGDPLRPSIATTRNAIGSIITGWYYLTVNLNTNTYSFDANMWGVVGDATPNAWNGPDVVMEYNATDNYWEANLDLIVGTLKFRQNNRWTVTTNLGEGASASLDELEYDGQTNIPIAEAGNYNIKLYVDELRCTITLN
jgi:starch-binding outer membrane protein SusE/F